MATRGSKIKCGLCDKYIDEDQYRAHVQKCEREDDDEEVQSVLKTCPLCGKQVKDLAQHCQNCTSGNNKTDSMHERRRNSRSPPVRRYTPPHVQSRSRTKKCEICSTTVDEDEYLDHLDRCVAESSSKFMAAENNKNVQRRANTKKCGLCSETVDEDDYIDHISRCADRSSPKPKVMKNMKKCITCDGTFAEDDYRDHVDRCVDRSSPKPKVMKNTKKCITCDGTFAEDDYRDHVSRCTDRSSPKPKVTKDTGECIICSKEIPLKDLARHVNECLSKSSTSVQSKPKVTKDTGECIICSKEIPLKDLDRHVNECLSKSSTSVHSKSAAKQSQQSCFTCSSPVNLSKSSSHTIPCRSRHIYCLKCLQRNMNEYIQSNTAPVCHSTLCDYELSRYDVACLPLEDDIIKRLLPCVKSTQRPQCPFCLFYVDFNAKDDLDNHAVSCNSENLVSCEYCHCLYNMHRLDNHSRECRNTPRSEQQKALIDYIVPRTKYPLTAQQIRVFIENRKKNRQLLDPHSIVDALAELDGAFPFDVPTRDCDVCAESYIYDDIFVFGCAESHKMCYGCFEGSCTAKMNSNEILTCAMCTHQLQDGDIKQLRIPADRKKQFLEYQTQKTFSAYASGQGIIKCPNRGCKWVAEVQNANDRFQVKCPVCNYEFCSLCNQQYHFRTTCQQLPELTQRWFFWCNTERGNYWQARAQQDANFRAQLQDYQQQTAANAQRNEELRQRYTDLLADETYKAQNCRLCPNCRRVVQHLSGCDAMVCGRNYHGGDQQSGCGHGFNFSTAPAYVPLANTGPQQVRNNLVAPEQQKSVVHEGIKCDACQGDVQGIRFDCVHCASLIFCEKCEQRSTLEHSNQIRDQQKQQHVFQVITAPANGNTRR